MADATPYREDAAQVRQAQKAQKRQSRGIAMDWLFKDNGENIYAMIIGGLVGSYITNFTGAWTFNELGESLSGVPGYFNEVTQSFR